MLTNRYRQLGFSLIEALVVIAILGILMAAGVPSLRTWMINSQMRNAAESTLNGLQRARAEAVARNTNIAFSLTGGIPPDTLWVAYPVASPASAVAHSGSESYPNVSLAVAPASSATTVTFDSFGNTLSSNAGTTISPATSAVVPAAPFSSITFAASGIARTLQINIAVPGGNARMCDPSAAPNSPSAC